jgi:hypothetical protein
MEIIYSNPQAQLCAERLQEKLGEFNSKFDSDNPSDCLPIMIDGVKESLKLINETLPSLKKLKEIMGSKDQYYLNFSGVLVGLCLTPLKYQGMSLHMMNMASGQSSIDSNTRMGIQKLKEQAMEAYRILEFFNKNLDLGRENRSMLKSEMKNLKNTLYNTKRRGF